MTKSKLDKSVVCTAFACAVATFACGFVFCLSLLSSGEGCYLKIRRFWASTRGYAWIEQLRKMSTQQILDVLGICGGIIFVIAGVLLLIKYFGTKNYCRCQNKFISEDAYAFPQKGDFSGEDDVEEILHACRRSPESASWKKINTLSPEILTDYLKNEYPQVAAVVLSQLAPQKSAAVISRFESGFAAEIITKMLNTNPVDTDLVGSIGKMIAEDIANKQKTRPSDYVREMFKYLDSKNRERIISVLENYAPQSIRELKINTFSFEDLLKLSSQQISQLLPLISEPKLVIALRGASDELRNRIYSEMSERQSKIIKEALSRVGPIKLRDIEKAQKDIVAACRRMFADTL